MGTGARSAGALRGGKTCKVSQDHSFMTETKGPVFNYGEWGATGWENHGSKTLCALLTPAF